MLPSRFWKREGGTLDASHSLLMRRSFCGGDVESRMSSLPARSASLSPPNGLLSAPRCEAKGSSDCTGRLLVGVLSMPVDVSCVVAGNRGGVAGVSGQWLSCAVIEEAERGVKGSPGMQIERDSGESIPEAAVVAILDDIGLVLIWLLYLVVKGYLKVNGRYTRESQSAGIEREGRIAQDQRQSSPRSGGVQDKI